MGKVKPEEPLEGYKEITKHELAELRRMSAKESLTLGLKLIDDVESLSKAMNNTGDRPVAPTPVDNFYF